MWTPTRSQDGLSQMDEDKSYNPEQICAVVSSHFAGCLQPFARFGGVEGCTLLDVCGRLLSLVV